MKSIAQAFFVVILLFIAPCLFPQTIDNLNIYYKLINESVAKIDSAFSGPKENLAVKLSFPQLLDQLRPKAIDAFRQKGFVLKEETTGLLSLNYSLIDVKVVYRDSYTDGLLGEVMTCREVKLDGSYFIVSSEGINKPIYFNLVHSDTIAVEDVPNFENKSLPFTQGEIPQPPLFSNLIEPVIIIGALITTIILFFTVRSK